MNRTFWLLAVVVLFAAPAIQAQRGRWGEELGGPAQSISGALATTDVRYGTGPDSTRNLFGYSGSVIGLVYTRPSLIITLVYGPERQPSGAGYFDVSLFSWGEFDLLNGGKRGSNQGLTVPLGLYTEYHRFKMPQSEADGGGELPVLEDPEVESQVGMTMLGLGTGLAYRGRSRNVAYELKVTPVIGIASASLGDGTGHSRLVDAGAQVALDRVFGRFGLVLGYSFREQVWKADATSLDTNADDDYYNYGESRHLLKLGVTW